jgi:Resolvase, N terminal domain
LYCIFTRDGRIILVIVNKRYINCNFRNGGDVTLNVVGYIRVSTQGQAKDGYSLKYQEDEIKTYCKANGWNLKYIFRDEGISGAKINEEALEVDRVGLQEMLAPPFFSPN